MYLKSAFSSLLLILSVHLFAQQNHICMNEHVQLKERKKTNTPLDIPDFPKSISTKYLNTVVHIIYPSDTDSISSDTIETLIEDLNRLFRAEGIDTSLIHPVHRDKLMDSQIQFCLAKTDPEGDPTTGITHTKTTVNGFPPNTFAGAFFVEEAKIDSLGGKSPWDIDRYFNIWIAPMGEDSSNSNYGIPRPEYFPLNGYTPESRIPGALIDIYNFRNPSLLYKPVENLLAHECGHALGLLHTFHTDDFSMDGLCKGSDFIDDTPVAQFTFFCDTSIVENTCIDSLNDEPDHVTNFMNYACDLMFTPGQIATMQNNLSLAPSGLFDDTSCSPISSTQKNELENNFEFNIYPNPNDGNFTVQFQQPYFSKAVLSLYNSMGQIIFEKKIDVHNTLTFPVNRNELKKGIYYLNVRSNQGLFSKKLVVQ